MISRLARLLAALLGVTAMFVGVAAPAGALPPPSDTEFSEARIVWLLNEERRLHGLGPVTRNGGADHMAQYSANVQAWYGRLGHNPNLGRDVTENVGPGWRWAGENVGCGADADALHGMWMRSSGHAANMLKGGADTVGVGTVYARGCLWATVVFVDR
jgi:uncharacterized protein YkwD